MTRSEEPGEFAVVTPEEAKVQPYPYVWVETGGAARELHAEERSYLEEKFSPFDGARPALKSEYWDAGAHALSGYCKRSLLPAGLVVLPAPEQNPPRPISE